MASQAISPAQHTELKRIEFVRSMSATAVNKATELATAAAGYTPTPVKKLATSAFETVRPTVEPYAIKAVDTVTPYADSALVTVDNKVDAVVTAAESFYTKNHSAATAQLGKIKAVVHDGTGRFEIYAGKYFDMIDGSLKTLKGKLSEASSSDAVAYVSNLLTDLRKTVSHIGQMPREKIVAGFNKLQAAWESLLTRPEVTKALEYSNKSVKSLQTRAESLHDIIVAGPRYSGLLDSASVWLSWAQDTSIGSTITSYSTPYAKRLYHTKYVEAASPYATRVIDYWKPAPALEGIKTS
eukprot:CAMPEP_0117678162 /NCGR_PEP_ID=MMETSP0804-20121206/17142_1 /TAXON_ID=1074897 /ORGANISM="Tetraselmis astigmatica, Strain CCMP880" /LENGTH=296 /DNA_ID=CAMNT_0005487515 /DNA_START=703 /DNA_END=1593 /DNA_ORIENTATION=-